MEREVPEDKEKGNWIQLQPNNDGPRPRRGHIIRKIDNNRVLVFGGYQFGHDFDWNVQTRMFYLDLDTLQWDLDVVTGSPTPTDGPGIAVIGDVYASTGGSVFTGGVFETCNFTEMLDIAKRVWQPQVESDRHTGDNLEPRCWHLAVPIRVKHSRLRQVISPHVHPAKDGLYTDPGTEQEFCMVFGGRCNILDDTSTHVVGFRYYNDVMLLDTQKRRWLRVQTGPGPTPRAAVAAFVLANKVYIFGGRYRDQDENNYFFNDMWCFDGQTLTWSTVVTHGDVPSPCAGATAQVLSPTKVLLTGGFIIYQSENDFTYYNRVHLLDLETNTWTELKCGGEVPRPLTAHAMTLIDRETVMVFGGDNREGKRLVTHNDMYLLRVEPELHLSSLQKDCLRLVRARDSHSDLVIQIQSRDFAVHAALVAKRCPKLHALAVHGIIRIDDQKLSAPVLQLFLDYVYACHVPVLRDMHVLAQLCYCAEKYSQRELVVELRHQVAELTRANRQLYAHCLAEYGLADHVIEHESIAPTVQGLSEWHMSLEELLLAKSTMDFELHVTDDDRCESQSPREIFSVHRFVLANRSEFFAAAIRMALQRNTKSLTVEDISIRGARALLLYMYSDNVVLLNSIEICLEVLHFAAFSAMTAEPRHKHLVDHCRSLVIESLTIDNCLEVYEVALTVSDPDLATAILTWIAQYSQAILIKSKEEDIKLRPEILRVLSPSKPIVESQ